MITDKSSELGFLGECDAVHRPFFADLMARWADLGADTELRPSSIALLKGDVPLCFLYPSYRKKGAAVRFDLVTLRNSFGDEWAESLVSELHALAELKVGSGKKDLVIQRPAEASLDTHEMFKQVLLRRV
jgi:hypothetical protein